MVTGGTGSLGRRLVKRLLEGKAGRPASVTVFSRDEAKQHRMRLEHLDRLKATDEVIYGSESELRFRIGDVRDEAAVRDAVAEAELVFHAAALKQVPSCEYHPYEAVQTNILGAQNVIRAARGRRGGVTAVVGISTDKACKPVNVMGMTKAIQERLFVEANNGARDVRFNCVRYGNVIASKGSIVPLFREQIRKGESLTVTLPEMTRFLLTLEQAVDAVIETVRSGGRGEVFVPKIPAARITDVARALMDGRELPIVFTGIRPGEKVHEIMVSEEECHRTVERNGFYVIQPALPELRDVAEFEPALNGEYSSRDVNMEIDDVRTLLAEAAEEIESFDAFWG